MHATFEVLQLFCESLLIMLIFCLLNFFVKTNFSHSFFFFLFFLFFSSWLQTILRIISFFIYFSLFCIPFSGERVHWCIKSIYNGFAIAIDGTLKVKCLVSVLFKSFLFSKSPFGDKSLTCRGLRLFWDLGIFEANLNTS